MRWLEVRRHSLTKKDAARGRGSRLSVEGVALARLVGESLGPFGAVVTSASPRAIETAVAMGFAVDDTVELPSGPSGYVPGEVDHHDQWRWARPYRSYAELLGRGGGPSWASPCLARVAAALSGYVFTTYSNAARASSVKTPCPIARGDSPRR